MKGGEVVFDFKADTKDLETSTSRVKDIIKGNLASTAITKGISSVVSGVKNITSTVVGLTATGGMDRALNIENAEFKLKGLGHTAEGTDKIMDNALASVKGTAYGLGDAATVAASAVASGVKPRQDLQRTLSLVADASAISGRSLTDMGAIFNKVAANGKMTGEELNQMADSGIPMLELLGQSMGRTTDEIRKMVSAGEIGFDDFRNAIEIGMGGAAKSMGQTFTGNLENTKAALSRVGESFMKPLTEGLTPALSTCIKMIDMITTGTTDGIDNLSKTLTKQISKALQNTIKVIIPLIQNAIPVISSVVKSLVTMLPRLITQIVPTITTAILDLTSTIIDCLPMLVDAGIQLIISLLQGIAQSLPKLVPQIVNAVVLICNTITQNLPMLIEVSLQIIIALVQGIIQALPQLIDAIPQVIDSIVNTIIRYLPQIIAVGILLIGQLAIGIIRALPNLIRAVFRINSTIGNAMSSVPSMMLSTGRQILQGLINGITSRIGSLMSTVSSIASRVKDSFKKALKIGSPSKVFYQYGSWTDEGYINGLDSMKKNINTELQNMVDISPQTISNVGTSFTPTTNVQVYNNLETDPLGQLVSNIKTFSGGAKNDYNYGMGV